MKPRVLKPTMYSAILGLTFSAMVAASAANASENDFILDDAIDDYSHDVISTHQDFTPEHRGSGYLVEIVLDEAYHDYQSSETERVSGSGSDLPQAEFAAMEKSVELPSSLVIYD